MAEVVITTRVNNELVEKSINNFKDLKKEIRASKDELLKYAEGSDDFKRVQQNVSKLQTSLKDLGDTARIQGSGVERLQQSFSLLTDSFTSGDIEKGKIALTGLGQAMSAIPIFLLIEGVKFLIDNWKELSAAFDSSAQKIIENERALKDLSNEVAINKVQTDALIITKEAELNQLVRTGAAYQEIINKNNEINGLKQDQFAGELQKIDKEFSNLIEKQKILREGINLADFLPDALGGNATQKELKAIDDAIAELSVKRGNFYNDSQKANIDNIEKNQAILDAANKKEEEERKKAYEKYLERLEKAEAAERAQDDREFQRRIKADSDKFAEIQKENEKEIAEEEAKEARIEQIQRDQDDKEFKARIQQTKNNIAEAEKEAAAIKAIKQKEFDQKIQITQMGLTAGQNLSRAYFQGQLNQVKGNAKEELEIRKKQFEVEKAFNLARAVIDGIRAVQATLAVPPLAVANGILAAANVALIAATQFDAGSSGASISSMPSATLSSQPEAITSPAIPQFGESGSTQLNGGNGTINQTNTPITVRAIVVESDITNTQNTVSKERRTATFG